MSSSGPHPRTRPEGQQTNTLATAAQRQYKQPRAPVLSAVGIAHHRPGTIINLGFFPWPGLDDRPRTRRREPPRNHLADPRSGSRNDCSLSRQFKHFFLTPFPNKPVSSGSLDSHKHFLSEHPEQHKPVRPQCQSAQQGRCQPRPQAVQHRCPQMNAETVLNELLKQVRHQVRRN
jgi:hypothetical protein